MFIQADLGVDGAGHGIGGIKYLGRVSVSRNRTASGRTSDRSSRCRSGVACERGTQATNGYGAAFTFALANERIRVWMMDVALRLVASVDNRGHRAV